MEQNFSISIGKGAWDSQPDNMPEAKGIYFVYRCKKRNGETYLDKLLYIGETKNARARMKDHIRDNDVKTPDIPPNESLYYAFAPYDGSEENRVRIEAALIYYHRNILPKGVGNKKNTKSFDYDKTSIEITGKYHDCLCTKFTQCRVRPSEA